MNEGDPTVILEVGVSQTFEGLKSRVEQWLLQGGAHLVILVDIQLTTCEMEPILSKSSGSTGSTNLVLNDSQTTLPYGLDEDDLKTRDFKAIASKILDWHEQTSSTPLIQLQRGSIYFYRKPITDKDADIVFFDKKWVTTPGVNKCITTDDLKIPLSTMAQDIPLPIEKLKNCFYSAIKKQSIQLARKRARDLLRSCGYGLESSSEFEPTSTQSDSLLMRQETRSSKRLKPSDASANYSSSFSQNSLGNGSQIFHLSQESSQLGAAGPSGKVSFAQNSTNADSQSSGAQLPQLVKASKAKNRRGKKRKY
jgi:hypothetical protein